jgi:hypothetical protein
MYPMQQARPVVGICRDKKHSQTSACVHHGVEGPNNRNTKGDISASRLMRNEINAENEKGGPSAPVVISMPAFFSRHCCVHPRSYYPNRDEILDLSPPPARTRILRFSNREEDGVRVNEACKGFCLQ